MRLLELEPQFITFGERPARDKFLKPGIDPLRDAWTDDDLEERDHMQRFNTYVPTLAEAQGLDFLCPKCFAQNSGPVGTHGIQITFADRGVPDHLSTHDKAGNVVRWAVSGTGYEDLSTTPSILLDSDGGCAWHGFITNGDVTNA